METRGGRTEIVFHNQKKIGKHKAENKRQNVLGLLPQTETQEITLVITQ